METVLTLRSKVARYGNSLTVRVPAPIARNLGLHDGQSVEVRQEDGHLLIELGRKSRLAARLATVQEPEAEVALGPARGAECL
ncbi:MAG: AbrB/MazE/SpoVT family DNA-binding domain-containing protein [Microbacteriaceae bacterium]|nr:MAG: AbrB/MazE/SpoVT family DNA-binding domain-containing protein [Microbacteriaceae bacterium]